MGGFVKVFEHSANTQVRPKMYRQKLENVSKQRKLRQHYGKLYKSKNKYTILNFQVKTTFQNTNCSRSTLNIAEVKSA